MQNTKEIGTAGEQAAREYLEEKGYEIQKMNYTQKYGEIDIIALSPENVLVFAEVKTRKNSDYGLACEAVDRKKQEKIIKTAMSYYYSGDMRFDVVEVYYEDNDGFSVKNINHIENAFEAWS